MDGSNKPRARLVIVMDQLPATMTPTIAHRYDEIVEPARVPWPVGGVISPKSLMSGFRSS